MDRENPVSLCPFAFHCTWVCLSCWICRGQTKTAFVLLTWLLSIYGAQVYILKKSEGGRHTPFVNNYRPQLFARTADVTVSMTLPEVQYIQADFFVCLHLQSRLWY